ncbi:aromatic prenyltransferase [Hyalangium gracile]|uniref:aromatic prenyltransferase n=1 Tax=Hyalangium gracile TaxID=394092 RepID=UPI001CCC65F9|nr:aromatic prenyltransferase [Hyalangium gracile]
MELIDTQSFEEEQFITDMRQLTRGLGAGFKEDTIRAALKAFRTEFHERPVQFKATTKPGDGLYYRILDSEPINRTAVAREAGLVGPEHPQLLTLQSQILDTCPGSFSAGLDFDAGFGMAKAWSFTGCTPIERLCQRVPSLPDSVRNAQGLLRHFGLDTTYFVSSDFQHHTTNVYFGWDMELRTEQWLQSFAHAMGSVTPSSEVCYDILATQANYGCVALTFSWQQDKPLRWCTYAPEIPYDAPNPEIHLPALGRRLEVLHHAPTLNANPQYILAWAFSPNRAYVKLERGYARDVSYFLRVKMQVDIDRDKTRSIVLPRLKQAV